MIKTSISLQEKAEKTIEDMRKNNLSTKDIDKEIFVTTNKNIGERDLPLSRIVIDNISYYVCMRLLK